MDGRQRFPPMKNAAFAGGSGHVPFVVRRRNDLYFARDNKAVDSKASEETIGSALLLEEGGGFSRRNFAVDRCIEFARHAGGADRTVTVDETDAGEHRSTAGTNSQAERRG